MRHEDAPYRLELPAAYGEFPDPCGANPFPPDAPQHRAWADATAVAVAEVARIKAAILSRLAASSPEGGAPTVWDVADAEREGRLDTFDAWAARSLAVVTSQAEVDRFAEWLVSYANGVLRLWAQGHASAPAGYPVETLGTALRVAFAARVEQWKTKALKHVAGLGPAGELPAIRVTEQMKAYRKRLVREYRRRKGLTVPALARAVGISETAIRAICNEAPGRYSQGTQVRLLDKLGVTRAEWYAKR